MKKLFRFIVCLLVCFLVFVSISACSTSKISSTQTTITPKIVATLLPTITPTLFLLPTETMTPTVSLTPTETIKLPITNGTKVPQNFVPISSENAKNLVHIASFNYPEGNGINQIAFTQDNNIVIFSQSDRVLRILKLDGSIQKAFAPLPHYPFPYYNLFKLSTDGKHIAIGGFFL